MMQSLQPTVDRPWIPSFGLYWPGKDQCLKDLEESSSKTLMAYPEESLFYEQASHLFVEGDNLEAMKLLHGEFHEKVKMIYIDPPYNTGKQYMFNDKFFAGKKGSRKGRSKSMNSLKGLSEAANPGHRHTSWLNMMYPRLLLAKEFLSPDGVIFVSIDDNEVHHLRMILNEIYGEENFVAHIIWQKKFSPQNDNKYISDLHDHILLYAKNRSQFRCNRLPLTLTKKDRYQNPDGDPRGPWVASDLTVRTYNAANDYPVQTPSGRSVLPARSRCWGISQQRMQELIEERRIWFGKSGNATPRLKKYLSEINHGMVPTTLWHHQVVGHNQEAKQDLKRLLPEMDVVFDTPKPVKLIKHMLQIATNPKEQHWVMDFFAGSCTTAQAVAECNGEDQGNRRFLCVQLPELVASPNWPTIAEIGKERIRRTLRKMPMEFVDADSGFFVNAAYRVLKVEPLAL